MKRRFTYREWHYVSADENLFELTPESLFIYRQILRYV
jgi:hypothetical protein